MCDGVDVEFDGRTTTEEAGGRMADDVDVRVPDCGEQAPGHLLAGLPEIGVDRSNQDVEAGEEVVGPAQGDGFPARGPRATSADP